MTCVVQVKSNDAGQVVEEQHRQRGDELRERLMDLTKTGESTSSPNEKKLQSGKPLERNKMGVVGEKEAGGQHSKDSNADAKDNGFINTDVISEKLQEHTANNKGHDRSEYADTIPLFIIDGFSPDNKEKHNSFLSSFVQFAAQMTAAQLARFLFLTDSTLEENISKSMPDIKVNNHSTTSTLHRTALQLPFTQRHVGEVYSDSGGIFDVFRLCRAFTDWLLDFPCVVVLLGGV